PPPAPVWRTHPREDKVMGVLEAYCDESGIHRGASHCAVVGFVGSARNWQRFETDWRKASGGVDFHGSQFFARANGRRVKPYDGWTDDRARDYLRRLLALITSATVTVVGAIVKVAAFEKLSRNERRYLTGAPFSPFRQRFTLSGAPARPYFAVFSECIVQAAKCVKGPGSQVNFVFDRQDQLSGHARQLFEYALQKGIPEFREHLGELSFKDKKGIGGLQAADLLAHTVYRRAGTRVGVNAELDMATLRLRPMTHRR